MENAETAHKTAFRQEPGFEASHSTDALTGKAPDLTGVAASSAGVATQQAHGVTWLAQIRLWTQLVEKQSTVRYF